MGNRKARNRSEENTEVYHEIRNRKFTGNEGNPIYNDGDSLTLGPNGPVLLEDLHLIEKLASFNRERIPERVVHAKGSGAMGYFELTNCMWKYTKADVFNIAGKRTPVAVRFSTVIGAKGSADTLRDPRGFAVKFYTKEGNLDIVGNHIPVFFIRDAKKFPDMVHAFKPSPKNNVIDKSRFWDFIASNPEATNMITFLFSDLGTIKSFRTIEGFGVDTFVWVNNEGKRFLVKYHWKPKLGVKTINRCEAEILAGLEPDVAIKDLYNAISKGEEVVYYLKVQIMDEKDSEELEFDPLDATKFWPEDTFPLMDVGTMYLNKNPENFFGDIEQICFSPSNIVPGIELSNDKLLQGRAFAYHDAHRHRVGVNFQQLPINRPIVEVCNNNQDGAMRYKYSDRDVNYKENILNNNEPLVYKDGEVENHRICGIKTMEPIKKQDDFTQAGQRYRAMKEDEKDTLVDNILYDIWDIKKEIKVRLIKNFKKACNEFGERIERALKENNKI
ncbi:catalase [Hathewaya proteolytica DSM 3090]|uniref:Catalase n=1 Tax=Hathewaya proteolytica DSM 3090 TaxID=1121331 RepID=A0A1M6NZS8_9CLOT|nr:catalase [Hathewaya proteolytica]SHK01237.1 catalase [Hathewaya proteolytica DSM 3090]